MAVSWIQTVIRLYLEHVLGLYSCSFPVLRWNCLRHINWKNRKFIAFIWSHQGSLWRVWITVVCCFWIFLMAMTRNQRPDSFCLKANSVGQVVFWPPKVDSWWAIVKEAFIFIQPKKRWFYGVGKKKKFTQGLNFLFLHSLQTPLQSFLNIHGKNGLTDIKSDPLGRNLYYTSGRDGRVGLWHLTDDQNKLELLSLTNTSLGWIARLRWINHQLTYLAFQSVSGCPRSVIVDSNLC